MNAATQGPRRARLVGEASILGFVVGLGLAAVIACMVLDHAPTAWVLLFVAVCAAIRLLFTELIRDCGEPAR